MDIKDFFEMKKSEFSDFDSVYELNLLKQIVNLSEYLVKFEKSGKHIIIQKFIFGYYIKYSLTARFWDKSNYIKYHKINSTLKVKKGENCSIKEIKTKLLCDIYRQIIKNHIMMI